MEVEQIKDRCFIVKIKKETIKERRSVYEAARKYWAANLERAKRAEYVLAVLVGSHGEVIGVYKPDRWYDATGDYVEYQRKYGRPVSRRTRIAFEGTKLTGDTKLAFLSGYLSAEYIPGQNPVKYTYE